MGNLQSSTTAAADADAGVDAGPAELNIRKEEEVDKKFEKSMNILAAEYIRGSGFNDMKNMANVDVCNKMVVITADIINRRLSARQIKYLARNYQVKTTGGIFSSIFGDDGGGDDEYFDTQRVIYFPAEAQHEFRKEQDAVYRKRLCTGIARFYVQIAHLYAAIMGTINPDHGNAKESNMDYCYLRAYSLFTAAAAEERKEKVPNPVQTSKDGEQIMTISPAICKNQDKYQGTASGMPGMVELEALYFDDYAYKGEHAGKFIGMTPASRATYLEDVRNFYRALYNTDRVPDTIQRFKDIPIPMPSTAAKCKGAGGVQYTGKIGQGPGQDGLFNAYAAHLNGMLHKARDKRLMLLRLLDYVFKIEPRNDGTASRYYVYIHPELTERKLQILVNSARSIIIRMYTECERDYLKGLLLFEQIVEKRIARTEVMQHNARVAALDKLMVRVRK